MGDEKQLIIPDMEILGQKFYLPNTTTKLFGFILFILSLLTVIIILICRGYSINKTKDGWSVVQKGNVTDEKADLKKGFIIGFWTPSDSTKRGWKLDNKMDSAQYYWEFIPENKDYGIRSFDSLNIDFGRIIKSHFDFKGYRRYKVFGEGEKSFKEGWWWNIGFEGECNAEFLKEFKKEYIKFWHPSSAGQEWNKLYVEVVGNNKN